MHTEDSHPDAGMDLMFGRRPVVIKNQGATSLWWSGRRAHLMLAEQPPQDDKPAYRISAPPRVPRREHAASPILGALFLVLALCIGVPAIVHLVSVVRQFLHSIG